MKSLILATALVALVAGNLFAQQCGTSSGTNQCGLNARPRAAEPAAVPQAAPASLQSVAVTEEWKAAEPGDYLDGMAGSDNLVVRPASVRVGLFNVGGDDGGNTQAVIAAARAEAQQYNQRVAELERRVIDAQARGEDITEDLHRALAQIRPQPTPDEAYDLVKQSPRFQADLKRLLEEASPQIGRVEIVTVE